MISLDHDLHIHTRLSPCCTDENQTPPQILSICRTLGLRKIGFANHAWLNCRPAPADWAPNETGFAALAQEIAAETPPPVILCGCEADTLGPGRFSISRPFAASLDYVILAANHFHFRDLVDQPPVITPAGIGDHLVRMFLTAVRSGLADIIPHVFMPMGYWEFYESGVAAIRDELFLEVFEEAAAAGVAIEVTAVYLPPPPGGTRRTWNIATPLRVLTLAKQAGCKFTLGTDSHSLSTLPHLQRLEPLVRQLALEPEDLHPIAR